MTALSQFGHKSQKLSGSHQTEPSCTTVASFFGSGANFPHAGSQVGSRHESCYMTWGALPQCKEVADTIQFCFRFDGTTPLERRRPWSAGAQEREGILLANPQIS